MEGENRTWSSFDMGCQDTAVLPLRPVLGVKEEQLSPAAYWITGWLMRYHKSALMKRQEGEEGSLYSRFV